jgi:hypothetical protein
MRKARSKGRGRGIEFLRLLVGHTGTACVTWPFSTDGRGYGILGYNGDHYKAHRLMCELTHGPAPTPTHQAAHSCGHGHLRCVNPRHLSWKTPVENMADAIEHGTVRLDSGRKHRKLTVEQVREIIALRGKESQQSLGERFGISWRQIGKIQRGVSWRGGEPHKTGFQPGDPRNKGWAQVNSRRE